MKRTYFLNLALAVLMLGAITPGSAMAATIHVNTTVDLPVDCEPSICPSGCSLRRAVLTVSGIPHSGVGCGAEGTLGVDDTIILPEGRYYLTAPLHSTGDYCGDLDIRNPVTIQGAGASTTILDGAGSIINGNCGGGIIQRHVNESHLTISGVTITGGNSTYGGAINGISYIASTTIRDSIITGNHATQSGGGVYSWGDVTITNSTITENSSDYLVGGIMGRNVSITGSLISENRATSGIGGVRAEGGDMTITNSRIIGNHVDNGNMGALQVYTQGKILTIENSEITGNSASGNYGGIISYGPVSIDRSSISGNSAGGNCGGLYSVRGGSIINSTISGNEAATGHGGGICSAGFPLYITNSTIYGNSSATEGAIKRYNSTIELYNTIVAGNTGGDCAANETTNGYNIDSDGTCGLVGTGDISASGTITGSLGVLAHYGGTTKTHNLLAGSPAIDAGSCVTATDQRGVIRPQNGACDIGAYESESVPPPPALLVDGDFDGTGIDDFGDIIWRNDSTNQNFIWLMNGSTRLALTSINQIKYPWTLRGVGDFDGDGKNDILWRNQATGGNLVWIMNNIVPLRYQTMIYIPSVAISSGRAIAAVGDLDGDGIADIVWSDLSGLNKVWFMQGTIGGPISVREEHWISAPASTEWEIKGAGDVNQDNKADIILHNNVSGENKIWLMDGWTRLSEQTNIPSSVSSRSIEGMSDLDGDGISDILLRDYSSGNNYVWYLQYVGGNVTLRSESQLQSEPDPNWQIGNK